MTRTTIIGIGSPYSQDMLGWRVIEYLQQRKPSGLDFDMVSCDRPGTLLLEYLKDTDYAVLVDAVKGGTCGKIVCIDKNQLMQKDIVYSSHDLGVAESLALGEILQLLPSTLVLYGIMTGDDSSACHIDQDGIMQLADTILQNVSARKENSACKIHRATMAG